MSQLRLRVANEGVRILRVNELILRLIVFSVEHMMTCVWLCVKYSELSESSELGWGIGFLPGTHFLCEHVEAQGKQDEHFRRSQVSGFGIKTPESFKEFYVYTNTRVV